MHPPMVTLLVKPVRMIWSNASGALAARPVRRLDPYAGCISNRYQSEVISARLTMTDTDDCVAFRDTVSETAVSEFLSDGDGLSDLV